MSIQKKPIETLKQQKESFLNYIKTKEKYSWIIADLFEDDEIEKIDNMEWVKQHLEQKWISKELTDTLEEEYTEYLRWGSYYWPINKYPEEIKNKIKKNNKITQKIKNNIIKEYKKNKKFITADIKEFINDKLSFLNIDTSKEIWKEINELEQEIEKWNSEIKNEQNLIWKYEWELEKTNILKISKKKELKKEILKKKEIIKETKEKIKEKEDILIKKKEQDWKIFKLWKINKDFIWSKNRIDIDSCQQSINEIKKELIEYIEYIPKDLLIRLKENIEDKIIGQHDLQSEKLAKSINEYLNYLYFWENREYWFIRYDKSYKSRWWEQIIWKMWKASTRNVIPTLYWKDHIDTQIVRIITDLWWELETWKESTIDQSFMDDVFIHTTWFDVLDEILDEWWLISTNEARRRARYNNDIKKSITQEHAQHKDIYFSRGFKKNWYGWKKELDDDFVFIANTMNAFARSGYGVPLNWKMQCNWTDWFTNGNQWHDSDGYSIISESALQKSYFWDSSYSKIDVKDVYIFLPESKKEIVENNPKYKIENANIIYIPKQYWGEMNYEIYEFIKKEINAREKRKEMTIPKKIITNNDGIESINSWYKWAFCEPVNNNNEIIFNPIKEWNNNIIIQFLEKHYDEFELSKKNIDLERLKAFLSEQKNKIDNINLPFKYPKELVILAIALIKIWLNPATDINGRNIYHIIWKKLAEFGYTSKELWILYQTIFHICWMKNFDYLIRWNDRISEWKRKDELNIISNWCHDWQIDFNQMKDLLIEISNLSLNEQYSKIIKNILKNKTHYN